MPCHNVKHFIDRKLMTDKIIQTSTGDHGLNIMNTLKKIILTAASNFAHNGKVVYSLDFEVTPHLLRHTYITNLIHASVDPKTVQYLAGHENSKITMDIYAKAKYNRPDELAGILEDTFTLWDAE